jgi:hypothetical protein
VEFFINYLNAAGNFPENPVGIIFEFQKEFGILAINSNGHRHRRFTVTFLCNRTYQNPEKVIKGTEFVLKKRKWIQVLLRPALP